MRKSLLVVGLMALGIILAACGGGSSSTQVASSTILVTNFNGPLNITGSKQSTLVDSSTVLERVDAVSYVSSTEVVASQVEGAQSGIFKSFDEGKTWSKISVVPGAVAYLDFVTSQIGFALSNDSSSSSNSSLLSTTNGGRTWEKVGNGVFDAVSFLSQKVGFAVMEARPSNGAVAGVSILRTKDGGSNWAGVHARLASGVTSAAFSFVNSSVGFLLAGVTTGAGTQAKYLYETTDSGSDWKLIASTPADSASASTQQDTIPSNGFVSELDFVNPSIGFARLSHYGFIETIDGGKTWHAFALKGLPIPSARSVVDFAAWDPQSFSVATSHTSFWSTVSNGHWNRSYPPYRETGLYSSGSGLLALSQSGEMDQVDTSRSQQAVSHVPRGTIQLDPFSTGMMAYTPSKMYFSADGTHWDQVPIPSGWLLRQGHFITPNFGLVVADDNGPPGWSVIEVTSNAGSNWHTVYTKFRPFAVDPVTASSWWALGGTDVTYTSNTSKLGSKEMIWNLYYTSDGGKSWDEFIANWHAVGGLDFVSKSEGYVWVPGALYRTVDRGSSFVRYNLPSQMGLEGISSMTFQPGGVGWSLGNTGYPIYHTIDAGLNWGPNP